MNAALLSHLKQDHYFALPAPKSTGRELFNLPWLETQLATFSVDATDVQRTLCEFTAQTIVEQVAPFAEGPQPQLLVCGGGAQNPLLMERLQALLPSWQVARPPKWAWMAIIWKPWLSLGWHNGVYTVYPVICPP